MKVLYLSNSAKIGGANRSLLTLWDGVRPLGVEPVAVCPEDGPMVRETRKAGVACHLIPTYQPSLREPFATKRSNRRWLDLIREVDPVLIKANDPSTARTIGTAARRSSVPLICHIHFTLNKKFIDWAWRYVAKPDLFIFNSIALRDETLPDLQRVCPTTPVEVVYNAVDVDKFTPRPTHANHDDRPHRIGIIANLIPVKGHKDFLRMGEVLRNRGINAEYIIVGEDIHQTGYGSELKRFAEELGINQSTKFIGFIDDVREVLHQLDILVVASHVEPFGICAIEAMASHVPVVATRVGGLTEVVEHEKTGILVDPASPEQMAKSVEQLLLDTARRQQMGEAGRTRVLKLFTQQAYASRMLEIYERFD